LMVDEPPHVDVREKRSDGGGGHDAIIEAQHESRDESDAAVSFEHGAGLRHCERFSRSRSRRESWLVIPLPIAMLNSAAPIEPGRHLHHNQDAGRLFRCAPAGPRPFLLESSWTTFVTTWGSSGSVIAGRRVGHDTEPPPEMHH